MVIKFHSPVVFVEDIDKAKDFYINVFDAKVEFDFGANVVLDCGVSLWKIIPENPIAKIAGESRRAAARFELCFETDNIFAAYDKAKAAKAIFLHELREETWGQTTIRFFDPDGHLIEIGESMEAFVKRLGEKLSIEELSAKTGIEIKDLRRIIGA